MVNENEIKHSYSYAELKKMLGMRPNDNNVLEMTRRMINVYEDNKKLRKIVKKIESYIKLLHDPNEKEVHECLSELTSMLEEYHDSKSKSRKQIMKLIEMVETMKAKYNLMERQMEFLTPPNFIGKIMSDNEFLFYSIDLRGVDVSDKRMKFRGVPVIENELYTKVTIKSLISEHKMVMDDVQIF